MWSRNCKHIGTHKEAKATRVRRDERDIQKLIETFKSGFLSDPFQIPEEISDLQISLFNSGDKSDCNNYRPITVLRTVSKIRERAVHQQPYGYLTESNLLTTNQFGFCPKLSTKVALAHFTDRVLEKLDNGMLTGAVFLDLSKAFDTVDHSLLLTKLKQIGASDNVTGWFRSYLSNHFQLTAVSDVQSTLRPVLACLKKLLPESHKRIN